ncbi:hypothetical protein V8G54_015567 [Vigna mungo]|uniref:adenosylmethionine decarboxylase n=1 Tax=Vigna mungo TaxID=3915 RepID=A0AAQ3NKH1_VIGMU
MAVSGFEGFEKRLELHFFGDDPAIFPLGLRKLEFESLEQVLEAVQCTVVSAVGNSYFDAYVLSESSLFVYPTKIIIKTCGTTQLLKSILPLIQYAHHLGLTLSSCRYTRGSFIFPKSQPFPHTSFKDEVTYLQDTIPSNLCFRKASIMPSKSSSHSWHVFTANDSTHALPHLPYDHDNELLFTMEICMTELDPILARKNGMDGDWYSTIHVTPEDGFSYASFECVGSVNDNMAHVLRKVVKIFRPGTMSISTTCNGFGNDMWTQMASAVEPLGMKCRSFAMDQFPGGGTVVFQTFSGRRKSV